MNVRDYQFIIERGAIAKDLHAVAGQILRDGDLTAQEKYNLGIAVGLRFSSLNAAAATCRAPRWDRPKPTAHRPAPAL